MMLLGMIMTVYGRYSGCEENTDATTNEKHDITRPRAKIQWGKTAV